MAETAATMNQGTPHGNSEPIVDLVVKDFKDRAAIGERKYGEKLKGFNGRDALTDAYQEAIDLVMYLRQEIYEREQKAKG